MASVWIRKRQRKRGGSSFRVEYRPGGREAGVRFAGSFPTLKLAKARRDYVLMELAAGRMPDLGCEAAEGRPDAQAGRYPLAGVPRRRRRGDAAHLPREPRADPPRARRPCPSTRSPSPTSPTSSRSSARSSASPAQDALDAGAGARPRGDRAEPGSLTEGEAPPRRAAGSEPADRRTRRGRRAPPPPALPAARARARRQRDEDRRARAAHLGRRRRAARPLARLSGRREVGRRALGDSPARAVRRRHGARAARGSHPRAARLPGLRRRQVPHGAHPRLHGRRDPAFSARTISDTGASRCSTWAGCRGPGSASSSATATS